MNPYLGFYILLGLIYVAASRKALDNFYGLHALATALVLMLFWPLLLLAHMVRGLICGDVWFSGK